MRKVAAPARSPCIALHTRQSRRLRRLGLELFARACGRPRTRDTPQLDVYLLHNPSGKSSLTHRGSKATIARSQGTSPPWRPHTIFYAHLPKQRVSALGLYCLRESTPSSPLSAAACKREPVEVVEVLLYAESHGNQGAPVAARQRQARLSSRGGWGTAQKEGSRRAGLRS